MGEVGRRLTICFLLAMLASCNKAPPAKTARPINVDAAVVIYGSDTCEPCHQAAAFLDHHGVRYVARNLDGDEDAVREMNDKLDRAGLTGGAIPVLDVDGHILVGFNARAVDRVLRLY